MTDNLTGSTTATFGVALSQALDVPIAVVFYTEDGTAKAGVDYQATTGTLIFEAGETNKSIGVIVYGRDPADSSDASRTFNIRVQPPANAILGSALTECSIIVTDAEGTPVTTVVVATGPRGVKGEPGLSAYQLAVLQGAFTGTLAEWLAEVASASQAAIRSKAEADRSKSEADRSAEIATIVSALNEGQEFFETEAELLVSTPTATKQVAKALDTKRVWLWRKQDSSQQDVNIPVTYIDGAAANSDPGNPSAIAPGVGRAHLKINVSSFESLTIQGAKTDGVWPWTFRDASLVAVQYSTFTGNGTVAVPNGAVWAYRTVRIDSMGLLENPGMTISGRLSASAVLPTTIHAGVIGDSTIAPGFGGLAVPAYIRGMTYVSVATPGDTIQGQSSKWAAIGNYSNFKVVIIQIGLNDLLTSRFTGAITRYQNLVNQVRSSVPAGCKIYIAKMTPARQGFTETAQYTNWLTLNEAISGQGATPITGVDGRISSHIPVLGDSDGNLRPEFDSGDHVHQNPAGRNAIANAWLAKLIGDGLLANTGAWINTGLSEYELSVLFTKGYLLEFSQRDIVQWAIAPIEGAAVETTVPLERVLSPGADRSYLQVDVSNVRQLIVSGARTDVPSWKWVLRDQDMNFISMSTTVGNTDFFIPKNAKWAMRTYSASTTVENDTLSISLIRLSSAEIDNLAQYVDEQLSAINGTEQTESVPVIPIDGAAANTSPSNPNATAPGPGRAYIRFDVSRFSSFTVQGARTNIAWPYVFRDKDLIAVQFPTFTGNGTLAVPEGAKWAYRTVRVDSLGLLENSSMTIVGTLRIIPIRQQLDIHTEQIADIEQSLTTLSGPFDPNNMLANGQIVSPNHFIGSTQNERIDAALAFIKKRGWGVLELGMDTISVPNTNVWMRTSAMLLPDNCWVYINHSTLKLADGIFDNIIRNDGIVPSADPYKPATELNENRNVRIIGSGIDSAFIEGPDVPYKAPHPVNGGAAVPWVGDAFGWRTIGILLANTKEYRVHDFKMSKTTCWAISQEHGCSDFDVYNIAFDTSVKNGDGVDVRQGCSNGRIFGITGVTSDDTVALSALKNFIISHPSGTYIFPMQVGGYEDRGAGFNIEDVRIWDIKGSGNHQGVRLLASGGSKLIDINIEDIADKGGSYTGPIVLVSSGYGSPASMGDINRVFVNNVRSNQSSVALKLDGPIQNSQFNFIRQAKVGGTVVQNTATFENSEVTNASMA